jgi:hypothetical protein
MNLLKLTPMLLAGILSTALADEYQDAVSKYLPGYRIMRPSDFALGIEDDVDPDLESPESRAETRKRWAEMYARVKDNPSLILGHFSSTKTASVSSKGSSW